MTHDPDIRAAKSIVDYIFRWMGKKFLSTDQQEEIGILSPEVRARLAASYNALEGEPAEAAVAVETTTPGQTALFNNWEDGGGISLRVSDSGATAISAKLSEALRDGVRVRYTRRRALVHECSDRDGEGCAKRLGLERADVRRLESSQGLC
jgi:hypothetical protein